MQYSQATLGENIRYYRKKRNLSIDELAEILDISSPFLGLVERGKRGLSLNTACRISEVFDMPLDNLLGSKTKNISIQGVGKSTLKLNEPKQSTREQYLKKLETLLYNVNEEELKLIISMVKTLKAYSNASDKKTNSDNEDTIIDY